EYTIGQFVEFIYTNSNFQNKNQFGRIEAIALQSESESNHSDIQIKDALKMLRLLSHNELRIYCSHLLQPVSYDFCVSKILYYDVITKQIQIQPVNLQHHHPSEHITVPNINKLLLYNMKVFKFMIDVYNNDFGTFHNTYYSLGGVYIQIGNKPFNLRKQLKNYFIVGFVPFRGNFDDVMYPLLQELYQLEKAIIMKINNDPVWIIASIRLITADLHQRNSL
ncbi:33188_t:CDS:2, partial [Gigaspora margarita]